MKNIFIIGSKGIPANYGGFETFVEYLTKNKVNNNIKYHVSCLSNDKKGEFYHNNARCFYVKVPKIGSARAVIYDFLSLREAINYIARHNLKDTVIYILASRIGPFLVFFRNKIKKLGIKIYLNPDGNEWKRSKWGYLVRKYWKISEKKMIKHADLVICDSKEIETYVNETYKKFYPKTTFISYGASIDKSTLDNDDLQLTNWFEKFQIKPNNYYLVVGRFVPENNLELIISEFMLAKTNRDLVIITNVEENKFFRNLVKKTNFQLDNRIKIVGTVYEQELLKKIRESAYAYIHGHEVGGTNPSLLESLASTQLNLLLNVKFNYEVGLNAALYFSKERGSLTKLIEKVDSFSNEEREKMKYLAYYRIKSEYSWEKIIHQYEELFINGF